MKQASISTLTGIGLTVAGAGALIGGYLDFNTHKDWYIEHNPDPRYESHNGDAPIALACGPTPTGYGMTLIF